MPKPKRALLIVDLQVDFADPSGSLFVAGAPAALPFVLRRVEQARAHGDLVVWSQDWHPASTPHFAPFGGRWPVHCVAGTSGAELLPAAVLVQRPGDLVIRKGVAGEDGYSAFSMRNTLTGEVRSTGLAAQLQGAGVTLVTVCGLATDWCVKATALDALTAGFTVEVAVDATAGVELRVGDTAAALREIEAAGGVLC
ncbi:MAG: isochorismatase family protein [Chloroflexi bacterium]|nr:isochorismatase family protein [Chloroflexota bacterium]